MAGENQEVKVRVALDTGPATGELRELSRKAASTAKRVGQGIRGTIGKGLGAVGLGGGIGIGLAAVRGATQSGFGDVLSESLGGFGARMADFFLGELNEQAIGKRAAREDVISGFGYVTGADRKIPQAAYDYFDAIAPHRVTEARGRELIEMDDKFRGPGIDELLKKILEGLKTLVMDAITALGNYLLQAVGLTK